MDDTRVREALRDVCRQLVSVKIFDYGYSSTDVSAVSSKLDQVIALSSATIDCLKAILDIEVETCPDCGHRVLLDGESCESCDEFRKAMEE